MRRVGLIGAWGIALGLAGCTGGGGAGQGAGSLVIDAALLTNLAQVIIVPTYQALVAQATTLQQSLASLKATPNPTTLAAAQTAWIQARIPWEQGEAFQFGPQRVNAFEGTIDTFPVSEAAIAAVLASTASIDATSIQTVGADASGFHAIEFLLFGEDGKKAPGDFKPREFDYMNAAAAYVIAQSQTLLTQWTTGVNGQPGWASALTTAGQSGNVIYPSTTAAGQDIFEGLGNVCLEVHNTKIAGPFTAQNASEVESRYSANSLADFANNIQGVQNLYLGAPAGATAPAGVSLSAHVAVNNPALDQTIQSQITAAIQAIQAIPAPYASTVTVAGDAAAINQALSAVSDLTSSINSLSGLVQ